ncbi:Multidrug export protein EmrB [compost metagenome]
MTTQSHQGADQSSQRGFITLSVMLATIMQALDTTIANVALPHMQGAMGATQDQISWVLTSYIVAAAIFMPLTGFISARIGRKRLFMWSVAGFTVASMLCGAAQSLDQIVVFRLLQGIFGASLVPLSQAVLLDTYPPEKHGSAMALWGIGVMVGPILGPSLGGSPSITTGAGCSTSTCRSVCWPGLGSPPSSRRPSSMRAAASICWASPCSVWG